MHGLAFLLMHNHSGNEDGKNESGDELRQNTAAHRRDDDDMPRLDVVF